MSSLFRPLTPDEARAQAAINRPITSTEVYQRTAELRFRLGVLEQCWRSPDGRAEWRAVPTIVYGGAPDTGR